MSTAIERAAISSLIRAAEINNLDAVTQILTQTEGAGLQIINKCSVNKNALMAAALNGHLEIVKYLVSVGANVNTECARETILEKLRNLRTKSSQKFNEINGPAILRFLETPIPSFKLPPKFSSPAAAPPINRARLAEAARLFNSLRESTKPLPSEEMLVALLDAIEQGTSDTREMAMGIIKEDPRIITMVLPQDSTYDISPLCTACRQQDVELVAFMLHYEPDVNKNGTNRGEYIPLQAVLYSSSDVRTAETKKEYDDNEREKRVTEIVRLLFEHGAKVPELDRQEPTGNDSFRNSCVYWACRLGHIDSLSMLLERGGNPNYGIFGLNAFLEDSNSTVKPNSDEWSVYNAMKLLLCSKRGASAVMCGEAKGGYRRHKSRRKGKKYRKTRRYK
jgi:ankyrin repeat protein